MRFFEYAFRMTLFMLEDDKLTKCHVDRSGDIYSTLSCRP